MPDEIIEIVITAPDEEWLVAFTRRLIEQHLAAAGHHTTIRSLYTWNGETHDRGETRVALHTRALLFDTIASITADQHPYEVPCVIAVPVIDASDSYRSWVLDSTRSPSHSVPEPAGQA